MHTRKHIVGGKHIVSPDNKIALLITIDTDISHFQVTPHVRRESVIHRINLKCILDWNWIEYGFQVMVAVIALTNDIQPEINLCNREIYHICSFFICKSN